MFAFLSNYWSIVSLFWIILIKLFPTSKLWVTVFSVTFSSSIYIISPFYIEIYNAFVIFFLCLVWRTWSIFYLCSHGSPVMSKSIYPKVHSVSWDTSLSYIRVLHAVVFVSGLSFWFYSCLSTHVSVTHVVIIGLYDTLFFISWG